MDFLQTIIGGLLGGGLIGLVEFLIRRHDERQDKNSEVLAAIQKLDLKIVTLENKVDRSEARRKEDKAIDARKDILRFGDEMREGRKHSKDSWDQCLIDITEYEQYCGTHPDFRNGQAVATIEHIKKSYSERLEKNDFL